MPLVRPFRTALCATLALCLLLPLLIAPLTVSAQAVGTGDPRIPLPALDSIGSLSAQSAVLIDAASGQVLYAKNEQARLPMASTTKIMTALCAVELGKVGQIITVSPDAVGIEGSSIYLYENEQLTLEQLLYALLLESANDAAAAIAIALCGNIESFADYMNAKAGELGLENTHFENPHGLDGEQHYTTAHDLALIAREALEHPTLRNIFATRKITIPLGGTQGARSLINHNKMLRYYEGAIGVKTGFTKRSGRCLVSAAERDGLTLIAVTLNAPDDWSDHTRMLDAGFAAYDRVVLCDANSFQAMVPVTGGKEGYVIVQNAYTASITLPKHRGAMLCTVELPRFLYAAVSADTMIGTLVFRCDTDGDGLAEELCRIPLRTAYGVERRERKTLFQKIRAWLSRIAA